MIIRPGNHRQVQRVGEFHDCRSVLLDHSHSLGRGVAQLDCIEPREAVLLVVRQFVDVPRNRENEKRRRRGYGERGIARRIVPVALGIYREGRIDSDRDDVLVLIARFQAGKQCRSVAGVCGIAPHACQRACETLVIGDVRHVEAGTRVPCAIALRREPGPAVPRRVRVTVEVDHDVIGIMHHDRGHGARDQGATAVNDKNSSQCGERGATFTKN